MCISFPSRQPNQRTSSFVACMCDATKTSREHFVASISVAQNRAQDVMSRVDDTRTHRVIGHGYACVACDLFKWTARAGADEKIGSILEPNARNEEKKFDFFVAHSRQSAVWCVNLCVYTVRQLLLGRHSKSHFYDDSQSMKNFFFGLFLEPIRLRRSKGCVDQPLQWWIWSRVRAGRFTTHFNIHYRMFQVIERVHVLTFTFRLHYFRSLSPEYVCVCVSLFRSPPRWMNVDMYEPPYFTSIILNWVRAMHTLGNSFNKN